MIRRNVFLVVDSIVNWLRLRSQEEEEGEIMAE